MYSYFLQEMFGWDVNILQYPRSNDPVPVLFFLILVISPRHKQSSILLYFYLQQNLFLNEYRLEVKGYLRQGRTETIPSRQCKLFSPFDLELFFGLGQSIIDVVFWIQDWKGWFYHNKKTYPDEGKKDTEHLIRIKPLNGIILNDSVSPKGKICSSPFRLSLKFIVHLNPGILILGGCSPEFDISKANYQLQKS